MAVTHIDRTSSPSRERIDSLSPTTGEVLGTVPVHTEDDVAAAIVRARAASETWRELGFEGRREELFRWRRALAARAGELADLMHLEGGKPRVDAVAEIFAALSHLQHAATRAEKALREHRVSPGLLANFRARISYHPLGVVGVIGPWNYPVLTPLGSIAYALAAGNAVVFKPSELTPLTGQLLIEIGAGAMTTPDVLQIVTGDGRTGAALARSAVDKIAFTGSVATGRRVMAAAAERLTPVLLELGGKDAMIVDEDADLDRAAADAVYGSMSNAGQACVSVERCYVHDEIYDAFLAKVLEEVRGLREGDHIGPITMPRQVDLIREHLEDAVARGATVHAGGVDDIRGSYVAPTVVSKVTPEMKLLREETFGPVLPIIRVDSAEEAVRLANGTPYGLGSSIYGRARVRALADRIRAGMTSINSVLAYTGMPNLPFGGVGDSGFGRIHGDEGLREFSRVKSTVEERFALPLNLLSFKVPEGTADRLLAMTRHLYGDRPLSRLRDRWRRS